jgi:hypothetical protein
MSQLILNQQLWAAVCKNDTAIVEAALVAGADPNFRDSPLDPTAEGACFSTHSILHEACFRGHEESVALLLRHGAEQCQDGTYDLTPLHLACLIGHLGIITRLVERGADVKASDGGGDSVLMCAMMGENPYASPPVWLYEKMETPSKIVAMLDYLVKAGADPNQVNVAGEAPLWNAIRYQGPEVFAKLLESGADVRHTTGLDMDLIAEAAETLSRADVLSDIPHHRKEGNGMRKRVMACMEIAHHQGLPWRDIPENERLMNYPSEKLYSQMKSLWASMTAANGATPSRSATP